MLQSLAAFNPEIVDVQGLWRFSSSVNLAWHRRSGCPYVVTPRGMLNPRAVRQSRWKKRLAHRWFEGEHLRRANCIRVTSEMEARDCRAFGLRQPIAVVANGIADPGDLACCGGGLLSAARRRVLFLSRIHPQKGIDHLLRAWASVQDGFLDWELVIAGPDEVGHRATLAALSNRLCLRRVLWEDGAYGAAKERLYRSADLFVLPTYGESFGLVVVEALSHGVPVITTRFAPWAGLEHYRCGWWIPLSDDTLVAALREAMSLTEPERRAAGERGREWVRAAFSWPAVAKQMHEVYAWILGGGSCPPYVMTD
jgi:glycosyltransferase involved in cell wall biosynthesis